MRKSENNKVYDRMVNSVVGYLQQQGFSIVKANSSGYAPPARVTWDEEDKGILPDITGEYNGALYVFEIETGDKLQSNHVEDRWKLLSVHARRYNGKFYLVVPEPRAGQIQEVVDEIEVEPEFLKLRGVEGA